MKHSLRDALPHWLLTWLACVALDLGLATLFRTDSRWWLAAALLLLWCAMLALTERFGRFGAMLVFGAAVLGLCLLLSDSAQLADAARAAFSRTGTTSRYGAFFLLLLCAAAALPLSALLRFYWGRALLSVCWLALWIAAALSEWSLSRLVPAAMIPLLLLTLSETIRRLLREPQPDRTLTLALLLSLLPTMLVALMPVSPEPFDYPLLHGVSEKVEKIWHEAETNMRYRHKGDREFGMSFDGASGKADSGREHEDSGSGVLFVNPAQTPDGPLYLFGNAWDRFDGRGWSSTLAPETASALSWRLDTMEHLYALWRLAGTEGYPAAFSDYFRANNVYLVCQSMNIRTMFRLSNELRIFTDELRYPYADAPTGSLFDYIQRGDLWYRIYFLESNAQTRGALIAASEGKVYDPQATGPSWYLVAKDLDRSFTLELGADVNLERVLAERAALIRSVYLDTSGVSDRARALAEKITAPCGSDLEKVVAIGTYLRENYSYTDSPVPAPEGENLLDWLLFERREGYCTWYATAAALLSRSVGVPARYVQGFRAVQLTEGEFKALSPEEAHAWCECYIAGYGWVTLEATPGFESDGEGWAIGEEALTQTAETSALDEPLPLPSPTPPQESAPEEEPVPSSFRWMPVLSIAALPAALALVWLWMRARRGRRYAAADPAARLQMDLEQLLRDLRGKGYPRRPEEPLRQYFARVPWHYLLAREDEAEEMAALYDRTFFALATPSEEELARHRAFAARFRPHGLRQWLIWYGLQ